MLNGITIPEAVSELKKLGWRRSEKTGRWYNSYFKHIPRGVNFREACSLAFVKFRG